MMHTLTSAAAGTFSSGFTPTAADPAADPAPGSRTARGIETEPSGLSVCQGLGPAGRRAWGKAAVARQLSVPLPSAFSSNRSHGGATPGCSWGAVRGGTGVLTLQLPGPQSSHVFLPPLFQTPE